MWAAASTGCSPASAGLSSCQAIVKQWGNAAQLATQAMIFFNDTNSGPLIVNNAACVKSVLTSAFFASAISAYKLIGTAFAVVSLIL
jgi:hypothetical protein